MKNNLCHPLKRCTLNGQFVVGKIVTLCDLREATALRLKAVKEGNRSPVNLVGLLLQLAHLRAFWPDRLEVDRTTPLHDWQSTFTFFFFFLVTCRQ